MINKLYNTRKLTVVAIVLIGILYLSGAFFVFSRQDYDRATNDNRLTMQYVKSQYMEFKKLDTASEAKSLTRMMDKMNQISMRMVQDGASLSPELLEDYTKHLRLTGIIVMDAQGELLCEYSEDKEYKYESLKKELLRKPIMDVAHYSKKFFTRRIALEDSSYLDIGARQHIDGQGVIVCYYHTPANYIENYNLSLHTLLSSYNIESNGTVAISDGYKIIASNDDKLIGTRADKNVMVNKLRESGKRGELTKLTSAGGETYYGSLDRGRDFFAYVYFPASKVYATRWEKFGEALLLYLVVVGIFFYFIRRSEQEHLKEQRALDEKYKAELIKSAHEAELANNAKTEFLQRMSHDIRTPINGIRGMLEIAGLNINDHKKVNECLVKIGEATTYLLDLVSEILDMGRLNSGDISLEAVPFDLRKLCDEVNTLVNRQAAEKGIEITLHRDESIPQYVVGSPVHVKRVLINILNNAVKYNKVKGKINLSMKEVKRKNGMITIEFVCEDTGVGISEEFLPHVFEAFSQEARTARSEYNGSGLGLPIVKTLVEKMGGAVTVTSTKNEGTTFVLRLPFQLNEAAYEVILEDKPADTSAVRGMNLLVAEDNSLNMEILKFFLDKAEIRYLAVDNGKKALDAFIRSKEGEYDAVLMDIMMPEMDGLEATQAIRELQRADAKTVPIIAMTANAFVEDKQRAFAAGMTEHISKPLNSEVLLQTLAKHAKNKK